jgi:glycine cleavage system regulatory protein
MTGVSSTIVNQAVIAMPKTSLVLTILGQDRPGLVDSLAQVVAEHGGNWVESRMAHLAGQFAGILRVEVDAPEAEALTAALKGLANVGLESVVLPDRATQGDERQPLVSLSLVGQDRPGIIREISHVLAAQGVNVEELHTECANAPTTGQSLFRAHAKLRLPPHATALSLREALEKVAEDLMVDITLE